MRGADEQPGSMFSYVSLEERVPHGPSAAGDSPHHRPGARAALAAVRRAVCQFRPAVDSRRRSCCARLLLQALYTIRSERQLMEQLDYNLLFRWFVGLGHGRRGVVADDVLRRIATGLLDGDIAAAFFEAVLIHADTARLLSDEHFTVDGTLLEAWASQKSFRPRDEDPPADGGGNPTVNFHGERRRNATHQSTTDPDARLYKKARGPRGAARLLGACLDGASVGVDRQRDGHARRRLRRTRRGAGDDRGRPRSPSHHRGGDKAYDTRPTSSRICARMGATPHVARTPTRPPAAVPSMGARRGTPATP